MNIYPNLFHKEYDPPTLGVALWPPRLVKQQCSSPCAFCTQFHQHFMRAFFKQIFCQRQNVTRKICWKRLSYQKSAQKNVDEIDTCTQFHQHFMSSFFIRKGFFIATVCLQLCLSTFFKLWNFWNIIERLAEPRYWKKC